MKPRLATASLALLLALAAAPGAGAVHQSHHGAVFAGSTSQGQRVVLRVLSHHALGVRFGWRARCLRGSVSGTARFHRVRLGRGGRFFASAPGGASVRGKIGFDAMGEPAYPAPFSFGNNEARGRLRAVFPTAANGSCSSGAVSWAATR
jgi:hypothetical protein